MWALEKTLALANRNSSGYSKEKGPFCVVVGRASVPGSIRILASSRYPNQADRLSYLNPVCGFLLQLADIGEWESGAVICLVGPLNLIGAPQDNETKI